MPKNSRDWTEQDWEDHTKTLAYDSDRESHSEWEARIKKQIEAMNALEASMLEEDFIRLQRSNKRMLIHRVIEYAVTLGLSAAIIISVIKSSPTEDIGTAEEMFLALQSISEQSKDLAPIAQLQNPKLAFLESIFQKNMSLDEFYRSFSLFTAQINIEFSEFSKHNNPLNFPSYSINIGYKSNETLIKISPGPNGELLIRAADYGKFYSITQFHRVIEDIKDYFKIQASSSHKGIDLHHITYDSSTIIPVVEANITEEDSTQLLSTYYNQPVVAKFRNAYLGIYNQYGNRFLEVNLSYEGKNGQYGFGIVKTTGGFLMTGNHFIPNTDTIYPVIERIWNQVLDQVDLSSMKFSDYPTNDMLYTGQLKSVEDILNFIFSEKFIDGDSMSIAYDPGIIRIIKSSSNILMESNKESATGVTIKDLLPRILGSKKLLAINHFRSSIYYNKLPDPNRSKQVINLILSLTGLGPVFPTANLVLDNAYVTHWDDRTEINLYYYTLDYKQDKNTIVPNETKYILIIIKNENTYISIGGREYLVTNEEDMNLLKEEFRKQGFIK